MNYSLIVLGISVLTILSGCAGSPQPVGAAGTRQIGNLVIRGVPEIPAAVTARLQQYRNTRSAFLSGWVNDGIVVATRFADTTQLHRVARPLGAREQVTFFAEPVNRAYLPPATNDAGFIYARDVGGGEFYQLFWLDWETGNSKLLTDGKSRYGGVNWSNAGDRFAYTTTERNARNWDIHIQDMSGNRQIALETTIGAWGVEDWAPGDTRLLVTQYISINESYAFELDLADRKLTPLLDTTITAAIGGMAYSGDGRGVYFTSDLGAEFMRLHYLDLASGRIDVLTADVPWDVESFELAEDGRLLALSINEDGISRLSVWRMPERVPLALPELPAGIIGSLRFSPDSHELGFSLNQASSPTDVYSIDIAARKLRRWTRSEVGGLARANLVEPELIRYPTFDVVNGAARQIPAFIYRPAGPGPHPVVISIHGGPESQYRPRFSSTYQYFVKELGIAVIAPNVRGSAGYGKSYLKLDNGLLREDSVKDIGALLDWIANEADLDPQRVVVLGGSYGGYMVLASMVHYSDRLAAGVERVGISNFVTFLRNTQDYRRDLRRAEYGDERDPKMRAHLENISPLNHVDKITKPLLISQGFNDPRVPVSESEQILDAMQQADIPVWYVLALNEGHGFRKKVNSDYNAAATVVFLEQFLLR